MLTRKFGTIAASLAVSTLLFSFLPVMADDVEDSVSDDATTQQAEARSAAEIAGEKIPSLDDMRDHRQKLRKDLMIPSLQGMRGISYGIPGTHPFPDVEKVIETRLKQLPIPVSKIKELQSGQTKPVDGILQVKILGGGGDMNVVELTVTQWARLVRDPGVTVRSVTYHDQAVTHRKVVRDTVGKMVNQFVLDYLQANHLDGDDTRAKAPARKKKG
ncbi:MAG: hypothetical protein IPM23_16300 [Candidatus Melainabacteria bacterium]|nr:hypothetical protein [Candidatus Melainabacteria bacterium]